MRKLVKIQELEVGKYYYTAEYTSKKVINSAKAGGK